MNAEEARFLLSSLPPGEPYPDDPETNEALERINQDPALAAWFAAERRFDTAVAGKLAEIEPPGDLRASLLAGVRVSRPRPWWRGGFSIAAAAVIVLSGAALFLLQGGFPERGSALSTEADFPAFREAMLESIVHLDGFDHASDDLDSIRDWLSRNGGAEGFETPGPLLARSTAGCRLLEWRSHRVSLICFRGEEGSDRAPTAHLVILEGGAEFPRIGSEPLLEEDEGWATAAWSDHGRTYLLVSGEGSGALRRLLGIA